MNGFKIEHATITLSYSTATILRGYYLFSGKVLVAIPTLQYAASTPLTNVKDLYIQRALNGANNRVDVFAMGSGFVSGHVLSVQLIAIIEDV